MAYVNLIEETIQKLNENHLTPDDVKWVGSRNGLYVLSWQEFAEKFKDFVYYNSYGTQEVASDLVVVGDKWWLERAEYDGAEWWVFRTSPVQKAINLKFYKVDTMGELSEGQQVEESE